MVKSQRAGRVSTESMHPDVEAILSGARKLRAAFAAEEAARDPWTLRLAQDATEERYERFAHQARHLARPQRRLRRACQTWAQVATLAYSSHGIATDEELEYRAFQLLQATACGEHNRRETRTVRRLANAALRRPQDQVQVGRHRPAGLQHPPQPAARG